MIPKLEEWLKEADEGSILVGYIVEYLDKRIKEEPQLAECIQNKHWKKCEEYIFKKAEERISGQKTGRKASVATDDDVYEWAEDFVRKEKEESKPVPTAKPKVITADFAKGKEKEAEKEKEKEQTSIFDLEEF